MTPPKLDETRTVQLWTPGGMIVTITDLPLEAQRMLDEDLARHYAKATGLVVTVATTIQLTVAP